MRQEAQGDKVIAEIVWGNREQEVLYGRRHQLREGYFGSTLEHVYTWIDSGMYDFRNGIGDGFCERRSGHGAGTRSGDDAIGAGNAVNEQPCASRIAHDAFAGRRRKATQ